MSNDAGAVREIAAACDGDVPRIVTHYVYAPTGEAAEALTSELRCRGFRVETRMSGDGVNWLISASHEVVPTQELMGFIRSAMNELVAGYGGEYDGWEADVRDLQSPAYD